MLFTCELHIFLLCKLQSIIPLAVNSKQLSELLLPPTSYHHYTEQGENILGALPGTIIGISDTH